MSKGVRDVFALVINFWGSNWKPKHVTFGLFEYFKTIWQALGKIIDWYFGWIQFEK
jgi:hypothetical protein